MAFFANGNFPRDRSHPFWDFIASIDENFGGDFNRRPPSYAPRDRYERDHAARADTSSEEPPKDKGKHRQPSAEDESMSDAEPRPSKRDLPDNEKPHEHKSKAHKADSDDSLSSSSSSESEEERPRRGRAGRHSHHGHQHDGRRGWHHYGPPRFPQGPLGLPGFGPDFGFDFSDWTSPVHRSGPPRGPPHGHGDRGPQRPTHDARGPPPFPFDARGPPPFGAAPRDDPRAPLPEDQPEVRGPPPPPFEPRAGAPGSHHLYPEARGPPPMFAGERPPPPFAGERPPPPPGFTRPPPPPDHGPHNHHPGGPGAHGFRGRGCRGRGPWGRRGMRPDGPGFRPDFNTLIQKFGTALGFDPNVVAANLGVARGDRDFVPAHDLFDLSAEYLIHVSLPGAAKEDIGLDFDGEKNTLRVGGVIHRPNVDEQTISALVHDGRRGQIGAFEVKVSLPNAEDAVSVDVNAISAKLRDGVLVILVPKIIKKQEKKSIRIDTPSPSPERASSLPVREKGKGKEPATELDMYETTPAPLESVTEQGDDHKTDEAMHEDPPEVLPEYSAEPHHEQGYHYDYEYDHDHDHHSNPDSKDGDDEGEYVKINVD